MGHELDIHAELPNAAAELTARRERIAEVTLRAAALLGSLAYVPSAWLCLITGEYGILALDTAAYLAIIIAWRLPAVRYQLRAAILITLFYILGTVLSFDLGATGAGPLWLLAAPVVTAIFFDRRQTLFVMSLSVATALVILALVWAGWINWNDPATPLGIWVMMVGNIAMLAAVLALSVVSLIGGLRASAERAERFGIALAEQHDRLLTANEQLRREMDERRNAEAQLRQAEKMSAIGTLAAGIAHDVNNLLTPILASAEIMRADAKPASEQAEMLDRMLAGARGGRDLVRRVLAFSRPIAEGRAPLNPRTVFGDAARLLRATLHGGVEVVFEAEPGDGAVLLTVAEANQLVLNLGINGHNAMPHGGRLTIELHEFQADEHLPTHPQTSDSGSGFVRLTVRDTGLGMTEETRRRAFDPYFTTRSAGTGIGLSTVHGIATSAGGWIDCESVLGQGTAMHVYLPRVTALPAAASVPSEEPLRRRGAGEHVLVVDDEENVRTVAARVLQRAGYRTSTAPGGLECISLLERPNCDVALILTDLRMPGMSGLELTVAASTIAPGTPVILMSGLADTELHSRADAVGVHGVVSKPFETGALLDAVGAAFDSRRTSMADA